MKTLTTFVLVCAMALMAVAQTTPVTNESLTDCERAMNQLDVDEAILTAVWRQIEADTVTYVADAKRLMALSERFRRNFYITAEICRWTTPTYAVDESEMTAIFYDERDAYYRRRRLAKNK